MGCVQNKPQPITRKRRNQTKEGSKGKIQNVKNSGLKTQKLLIDHENKLKNNNNNNNQIKNVTNQLNGIKNDLSNQLNENKQKIISQGQKNQNEGNKLLNCEQNQRKEILSDKFKEESKELNEINIKNNILIEEHSLFSEQKSKIPISKHMIQSKDQISQYQANSNLKKNIIEQLNQQDISQEQISQQVPNQQDQGYQFYVTPVNLDVEII